MKGNKGITLIALVITIIVLLILAGVSIAMLSGDNSILGNASKSADANKIGEIEDEISLKVSEQVMAFLDKKYNNTTGTGAYTGSATTTEGVVLEVLDSFKTTYPTTGNPKFEYTAPTSTKEGTLTITSNSYKATGTVTTGGKVKWNPVEKVTT